MNSPTLFDMVRSNDPETSRLAAAAVEPGCKECIAEIQRFVRAWTNAWGYPVTPFQIAEGVEYAKPGRWDEGTIRRRVKDAGLSFVDKQGVSPRGRACERWTL